MVYHLMNINWFYPKYINQPVSIVGKGVENIQYQDLYYERNDGYWQKTESNDRGDLTYEEHSDGDWYKKRI